MITREEVTRMKSLSEMIIISWFFFLDDRIGREAAVTPFKQALSAFLIDHLGTFDGDCRSCLLIYDAIFRVSLFSQLTDVSGSRV